MKLPGAAAACTLLLIACGRAEQTGEDAAGQQGTPPPAEAPDERTVDVVLAEWSLSPSATVLAPGSTIFHLMNQGEYPHAFELERNGQVWRTEPIAPGSDGEMSFDLPLGTYNLYCPDVDAHGNHRRLGMHARVTVR
jgi:uncharacterized cupredoxin-like copper-binding protein